MNDDTMTHETPDGPPSGTAANAPEPPPQDPVDELIDDSLSDQDIEDFAAAIDPPPGDWPSSGAEGGLHDALNSPLPPPPTVNTAVAKRLVRDPHAPGAGVAAGLAHYLGVDPVLVRLVFIAGFLSTGPLALLAYLAGWVIMPKAKVWPPYPGGPALGGQLSGRTVGLVIAGIGASLLVGFNVDGFGGPLGSIIMIATGIWLLRQPQQVAASTAPPAPTVQAAPPTATYAAQPPADNWESRPVYDAYGNPIGTTPVKVRRSTAARLFRVAMVGMMGFVALIGAGLLIALVAFSLSNPDVTVTQGQTSVGESIVVPMTADDLLDEYSHNFGSLTVDLSNLDDSMFTDVREVDVDSDIGELVVLVPEDLSVQISVDSDAGEISLFGQEISGLNNEAEYADDDANLVLDINSDIGEVRIERVAG